MKKVITMADGNADDNWWNQMPEDVKKEVEEAMQQAGRGEGIPYPMKK